MISNGESPVAPGEVLVSEEARGVPPNAGNGAGNDQQIQGDMEIGQNENQQNGPKMNVSTRDKDNNEPETDS